MAGTYTKLVYHIVFSTKIRQPFITAAVEDELYKYIAGIIRGLDGACLAIGGMPDHIHILAMLRPKLALSDTLRDIKSNSSKWIHQTKPELARFAWQDGFSAFTVSKSLVDAVVEYIRRQKEHHAEHDYRAELLGLLEKHNVEYDEQ